MIRNVLVALPTVSRGMKSTTAISVARTALALQAKGISVTFHNIDSAEIVTARDMFANMLLWSERLDALLFVDSDMGFNPELVIKLLAQGAEFTAAACPRRSLDLPRYASAIQDLGDVRARSAASSFMIKFDWEGKIKKPTEVVDGFCSVAAVSTAISFITKGALKAMVEAGVVKRRLDLTARDGNPCWSFFGILEPDGGRLSEDYSFCYRWTKLMGRELPICLDEPVSHLGDFEYRATYADLL